MKPLYLSALILTLISKAAFAADPVVTTPKPAVKPGSGAASVAPRAQKPFSADSKNIQKLVDDNTIKLNSGSGSTSIRMSGYLDASYSVRIR